MRDCPCCRDWRRIVRVLRDGFVAYETSEGRDPDEEEWDAILLARETLSAAIPDDPRHYGRHAPVALPVPEQRK